MINIIIRNDTDWSRPQPRQVPRLGNLNPKYHLTIRAESQHNRRIPWKLPKLWSANLRQSECPVFEFFHPLFQTAAAGIPVQGRPLLFDQTILFPKPDISPRPPPIEGMEWKTIVEKCLFGNARHKPKQLAHWIKRVPTGSWQLVSLLPLLLASSHL